MTAPVLTADDAPRRGPSSTAPAPDRVDPFRGAESPLVSAARGLSLWPLYAGLALVALPGGAGGSSFGGHGPLALSALVVVMALHAHRPPAGAASRWALSVVGSGLLIELLADAIAGREGAGLGAAPAGVLAATTWLSAVVVYEVAPLAAASAGLRSAGRRSRTGDVFAHVLFLGLALGAYVWRPLDRGDAGSTLWVVSPWLAAVIAAPLAAARCGAGRTRLEAAPKERGRLWAGMSVIAWVLGGLFVAARIEELGDAIHGLRWGASPSEGVLWLLPALGVSSALAASALLFRRSLDARRAVAGTAAAGGGDGLTLERAGRAGEDAESVWVAIDDGAAVPDGADVTLLGARPCPTGVGPFRDGAAQWRARRAFVGPPSELARTLRAHALVWLACAGASVTVGLALTLSVSG